MKILIKNANLVSESNEGLKNVLIDGERIANISDGSIDIKVDEVIDAEGKTLIPGLIDMHVHLREPGFENKETLESGIRAAIHGGITTMAAMPNTEPPVDSPALVYYLKNKANDLGYPNLEVIACVTKGRVGKELSEMNSLAEEGAIAFSDDGSPVSDTNLMLKALEYSKITKKPIINHCEVKELSSNGYMREGKYSNYYGIYGIPSVAESIMVARDLELADYSNSKIHIAHVSTSNSLDLIRNAKKKGVNATCEVTHNHLLFTDKDLKYYSTNLKVNPPLPTEEDQQALIEGIKDGTIDIIVSDHAPHTKNEKEMEFQIAPYGISGLETLLGGVLTISKKYDIELKKLIKLVTFNPAKLFGIEDRGDIKEGYFADLVLVDKDKKWLVNDSNIYSKGKNTPFLNTELLGVVENVIIRGKIMYSNGDIRD
jgi:dihydroorotase